jgi:hypothetical protein
LRKLKEVDLKSSEGKIGCRGMAAISSTQHRNEILFHGISLRSTLFAQITPSYAKRQGRVGNFNRDALIFNEYFRKRGGSFMKHTRIVGILWVAILMLGMTGSVAGAEDLFKDYEVAVVEPLEVPSGSPAPESSGVQMAEKAVYQILRYNQKYKLFELVTKEGSKKTEIPSGKKILLIKGTVKEYTQPSVGGRIGRSFIPGGGYTGTAAFAAHYQFIDKESGKVIYETDLRTTSTGSADTVEYAMDRNGEALAKVVTKFKGK